MDKKCINGAPSWHDFVTYTDDELTHQLRLRAAGCRQKSMTARLAAVVDYVEALLSRGYNRSQVREVLVDADWHFTSDSFDSALSRVRKRRMHASASEVPLNSKVDCKETFLDSSCASDPGGHERPPSLAGIFASSCNPAIRR